MLTLHDGNPGMARRDFLRIGSLGALSLASLLEAQAQAEMADLLTGKSVIFLFQQGGPSQFETYDPKPEAPDGIRTVTGVTKTSLPGVIFGDTLQQLAKMAHKLTIVRSFQTKNGGHNIQPIVGPFSLNGNIGAYYSQVAGATRPKTGMPTNTVLFPQAVCSDVTKGKARGDLTATGPLGKIHSAFVPGGRGELQKDMKLNLQREQLEDRRQLLSQLDRLQRKIDATGELDKMDAIQKQAYQMLLNGGVAEALDLSKEDPKLIAKYDTSHFAREDNWSKVNRGKRGYYTGHAKSLGKLLLLARRLCQAGCGFITVHASYDGVWDMHADKNNLNMVDGMQAVGHTFDHAVAALIQDIEAQGLQDKILLVATGEMGRTPKINKRGGRDHWARLAPLLLYGGGIKGGQVIGQSTKNGGEPASENLTPEHLIATILRTLLDIGQLRVTVNAPQVVKLGSHSPIPDLL